MATARVATNPSVVNTCAHCGKDGPLIQGRKFCSIGCWNRSRTDHSPETLMRRFWAKVDKTVGFGPQGDCWKWTARIDGRGYGEIKVAGRYKKAHRIALFGPEGINDGRMACHRCDNPGCVRPSHLFAGVAQDNVRDMIAKGRKLTGRKLSPEQVREVRASAAPHRDLARQFHVDDMVIVRIRSGATYGDVT